MKRINRLNFPLTTAIYQALTWALALQTTEGKFAQLVVEVELVNADQIQWAKQIAESAFTYK